MGMNFPSGAAIGQVYNAAPGVSFVYTGTVWKPAPVKTALPKNYIVNASMMISQENGGASNNVNGYFPADQWMCAFVGFATVDSARVASVAPLFYPFFISQAATIRASLGAGDYMMFQQGIEGQRVADLQWGTPSAKPIVVRFTCNCSPAGNYALAIRNAPVTHSYVVSFAAGPGEQEFIAAIPGCTLGTWANNNTAGIYINFVPVTGTTFRTASPNSWQVGNFLGYTTMTNLVGVGSGTFNIGRVGMYPDPYNTGVAPPFAVPNTSDERRRCMRYWYRAYGFGAITGSATTTGRGGMRHPVPMRATPAGTVRGAARLYDGGATAPITSIGSACNLYAAEFDMNASAGGLTGGRAAQMYYQGDDIYMAMDARL